MVNTTDTVANLVERLKDAPHDQQLIIIPQLPNRIQHVFRISNASPMSCCWCYRMFSWSTQCPQLRPFDPNFQLDLAKSHEGIANHQNDTTGPSPKVVDSTSPIRFLAGIPFRYDP
ncbi:Hypothetical_protein [Hexamita inflata]|uniref:Hypothetical_protein n=1 Tax=Hexamita inflata TaxID=28002 RepID=A0AA86QG29_9EUKA|nr:Hypothetical protein HINF_LOCUS40104 [Hexamita inflata]